MKDKVDMEFADSEEQELMVHYSYSSVNSLEKLQHHGKFDADELAGVCLKGVHYYDFKKVEYINNTGIANLIDLLKTLMAQGIEVKFVNVNRKIKRQIKSLGLENILKCS